jgi:hypothetical protein
MATMSEAKSGRRVAELLRNSALTGLFTITLAGIMIGYGIYRFGSLDALGAALRGRALYIEPSDCSLAPFRAGQSVDVPISFRNLTSRNLRVIGRYADCGCTGGVEDLPFNLVPYGVKHSNLSVRVPDNLRKEIDVKVFFYSNIDGLNWIPAVRIHGRVLPDDSGTKSHTRG